MRSPQRICLLMTSIVLAALGPPRLAHSAEAAHDAIPALHVLQSYEISGQPSTATDVRWASDETVYLARIHDGVTELRLENGLPQVRQVVPSREALGVGTYRAFSRLAASKDFLAWGQWAGLVAWRPLAPSVDHKVRFDWKAMAFAEDVDLAGDRLLVLGGRTADDAAETFSPDGAVAFLGSAQGDNLQTFKPVLFDPAGPGAPHLLNCGTFDLGGARFLPGGSFFILPGFQTGAHLFDATGRLVHTWNTALLGLDADGDCASSAMIIMRNDHEQRMQWLNRHRIVDSVLALPPGPAVLIRSVNAGKVHWELDLLGSGGIETYAIPAVSRSGRERVRADYRNGKLVLLLTEDNLRFQTEKMASRLMVLAFTPGRLSGSRGETR